MKNVNTRNLLEGLSIFALGSLILGCLIVNFYLGQFGFWDFNFLRFQYIATGILFIISIVLTSALIIIVFLIYREIIEKIHISNKYLRKSFVYSARLVAFIIITFINSFLFLFILSGKNAFQVTIITILLTSIWTLPVCLLIRAILRTYSKTPFENLGSSETSYIKELVAAPKYLYPPVLFIFTLIIFSLFIYPFIPRVWGGGKLTEIQITLIDKDTSPINGKLIYQNPDSILIDTNDETYLIKENKIEKIQYLKRESQFIDVHDKLRNFLSN